MKERRLTTKRLVALSLFTALGLIMFLLESLFPPIFIPGSKMGLSNIFSITALIVLGPAEAFVVVAVRTLLGSFFTNASSLIFSFTAGIISVAAECVIFYVLFPRISLLAVSTVAAVIHNLAQNAVYALITGSALTLSYAPYLALIGIISGLIVGAATALIIKKIPLIYFERLFTAPRQATGV